MNHESDVRKEAELIELFDLFDLCRQKIDKKFERGKLLNPALVGEFDFHAMVVSELRILRKTDGIACFLKLRYFSKPIQEGER